MIKEYFEEILSKYLEEKSNNLKGNPLANLIRNDVKYAIIENSNLSNSYLVKASAGQGQNWAEIPWIGIFDKEITKSAQYGYYIVYLFDREMNGVFLSLNQGWTQYKMQYGTKKGRIKIKQTAEQSQRLLRTSFVEFSYLPIELHANNDLGKGYQLGHICGKYYEKSSIPDDGFIINDLRNIMSIYSEMKGLIGTDIINMDYLNEKTEDDDSEDPKPEEQIEVNKRFSKVISVEEIKRLLNEIEEENKDKEPKVRKRISTAISRNSTIAKYVKELAKYTCELCGQVGFEKKNGEFYVEVHHIEELGNKGLDIPSNLICVCPRCHRIIHYGSDSAIESIKGNA